MCKKVIEAIYENGVLKPLEKLNLKEGERIKIKIIRGSIVEKTFGILPVKKDEIKKIIEEIENEWGFH